jgi:hypothetical protein
MGQGYEFLQVSLNVGHDYAALISEVNIKPSFGVYYTKSLGSAGAAYQVLPTRRKITK